MKLKLSSLFVSAVILAGTAVAQTSPPPSETEKFLGIATIPLWENGAPEAKGKAPVDVPTLTVFTRSGGAATGSAVIIAPGGAYLGLAAEHEGRQVADWFASRGVTAFVLRYRLGRSYPFPIPLMDAQRAIRLVRSRAKDFKVSPDRIGIIGFSAGGHLAATAGTIFDKGKTDSPDPIERVSSRPDFMILAYPWINAMKASNPMGYCRILEIASEKCRTLAQYSPDERITAETPPTFIYQTSDDQLTPAEGSALFYIALLKAGISAEMHSYRKGDHGTGLGNGDPALGLWTSNLEAWMRGTGFITVSPPAAAQKAPAIPEPRKPGEPFKVELSMKELLTNPDAKKVLVTHLGQQFLDVIPEIIQQFSLRGILENENFNTPKEKIDAIERDLLKIPIPIPR